MGVQGHLVVRGFFVAVQSLDEHNESLHLAVLREQQHPDKCTVQAKDQRLRVRGR